MLKMSEGRFYEAEFPELEEIVVVQVKSIVDMGAYAHLLEYNGKVGMMLLSELSKRRIRSVSKLLRVGRTEVCMVLRVDEGKGYIDLSKRRVAPEDAAKKEDAFAKAKLVHGIMRHVAGLHSVDVEELCMKVSWPLRQRYENAYEAFRRHVNDECNVWDEIDFSRPGRDLSSIAEKLKADIELHLRRRLLQSILRLRTKVEVSCSEYEGVDAVKAALSQGLSASRDGCELKVRLIACPLFSISCTVRDKEFGMTVLQEAIDLIKECILAKGGCFFLRAGPQLVGEDEENDFPDDDDDPSDLGSFTGSESEGEQDETMGALSAEQEAQLSLTAEDDEARSNDDENNPIEEKE